MIPTYDEVPEHWKSPVGPYRKAPDEYGGQWWLVNPFTSSEPWKVEAERKPKKLLPEGFEEIFGQRPGRRDFAGQTNSSLLYGVAKAGWESALEHFKRAGVPEWVAPEELKQLNQTYTFWEMGEPRFYEGLYGWRARFPNSGVPEVELDAETVTRYPHLVVPGFQLRQLERGMTPTRRHPFLSPQLWPVEESDREEVA